MQFIPGPLLFYRSVKRSHGSYITVVSRWHKSSMAYMHQTLSPRASDAVELRVWLVCIQLHALTDYKPSLNTRDQVSLLKIAMDNSLKSYRLYYKLVKNIVLKTAWP